MLHDLQHEFINGIYKDEQTILTEIDDSKYPAKSLLAIYRDSVYGGLLNALTEVFPVCKELLGDDFFNAMSMRYIQSTPSRSADINDYGETFPDFVRRFEPAKELVYLPDVMKLEWAWHRAYQTENVDYDDFTHLMNLPLERIKHVVLTLNPTMSLLHSNYPVHRIWTQNQPELNENNGEEIISLDEGECYLLIWRNEMTMHIDVLTQDIFRLLSAINEKYPLSYLQNNIESFEQILSTALGQGYIHQFHVRE